MAPKCRLECACARANSLGSTRCTATSSWHWWQAEVHCQLALSAWRPLKPPAGSSQLPTVASSVAFGASTSSPKQSNGKLEKIFLFLWHRRLKATFSDRQLHFESLSLASSCPMPQLKPDAADLNLASAMRQMQFTQKTKCKAKRETNAKRSTNTNQLTMPQSVPLSIQTYSVFVQISIVHSNNSCLRVELMHTLLNSTLFSACRY